MHLLDRTLESPAENLALDEALFELCEQEATPSLRFWEPGSVFVVVGYTNRIQREVNVDACRSRGVPVLRRLTGGGTVVQAPGVLNFTVVLPIPPSGPLSSITGTNRYIMERHRKALQRLVTGSLTHQGDTDLALDGRKISGNAQKRGRRALIFHGTFLLALDTTLVEDLLRTPSREPDYRRGRSHGEFLSNLQLSTAELKAALQNEWQATELGRSIPDERVRELARMRYEDHSWNFRR